MFNAFSIEVNWAKREDYLRYIVYSLSNKSPLALTIAPHGVLFERLDDDEMPIFNRFLDYPFAIEDMKKTIALLS